MSRHPLCPSNSVASHESFHPASCNISRCATCGYAKPDWIPNTILGVLPIIRVDFHRMSLNYFRQQVQKMFQISALPVVATIGNVIPAILDFQAQWAGHEAKQTRFQANRVKPQMSKVKKRPQ